MPSLWPLAVLLGGFGALAMLFPATRIVAAMLLGIAHGGVALAPTGGCEGELTLTGRVSSIVERIEHGHEVGGSAGSIQRFLLEVDRAGQRTACRRVRVVYYGDESVGAGDRVVVVARLRVARGSANDAGFDGERWFRARAIDAIGMADRVVPVRNGDDSIGFAFEPMAAIARYRQTIATAIDSQGLVYPGVIKALAIGHGADIDLETRESFRAGGAIHLLVVSGLHIAVVATLAFIGARPLALLVPIHPVYLGAGFAAVIAAIYVALAGFGLPIVRAYVMTLLVLAALVAGRRLDAPTVFAVAVVVVLLIDPLAPLDLGFWLSFGAVACLGAYFRPRSSRASGVASAWRGQWVMSIVFVPCAAFLIGIVAPLGFVANLLVVPLISMLVVPLVLLGVVSAPSVVGDFAFTGADFAIAVVLQVLDWLTAIEPLRMSPARLVFVAIALGAGGLLLPLSVTAKVLLAGSLVVLLCLPRSTPIANGHFAVRVLDVGQGLSVLVQTRHRSAVFDVGARFPTGSDMADLVVLPVLGTRGVSYVDMLLVSHDDNDHAGGAPGLLASIDVGEVVAAKNSSLDRFGSRRCRRGDRWVWDDVEFRIVYDGEAASTTNDSSCVLLVTARNGARLLLPGDIERAGERRLARSLAHEGLDDIALLVMPHHGSRTSSSDALLSSTRPRIAVASAGYANRFGHPHVAVIDVYARLGTHVLETARTGMVTWRSTHADRVTFARCREAPFWRVERLSVDCAPDPGFENGAMSPTNALK